MPSGIYFRSEENKKAFLDRMKGKKYHLGFKNSEEAKKRMSEARKKGIEEGRIIIWNKGKIGVQKQSIEQKDRTSNRLKEQYKNGKRKVNNNSIKTLINYNLGKQKSIEVIRKIKLARAKQIIPVKDTSIEVKIQNYLKQLKIEFYAHYYINIKYAYSVDIFIPSINLIIECDGDYWHGNTQIYDFRKLPLNVKKQIPLDFERTAQLEEKGYRVLRLWENEIMNMDLDKFKERLLI